MTLNAFPLRIEWERFAPVAESEAHPEPVTSSRDQVKVPGPGVTVALAAWGRECGWEVCVQYSRGCKPHATTGRPGPVKSWWGVRFARAGWGACAVHDGKAWDSICAWGSDLPPFMTLGITELKEYLREPGWLSPEVRQALRDKARLQAEAAKERARTRVRSGSSGAL